jgi:hypothetical protein
MAQNGDHNIGPRKVLNFFSYLLFAAYDKLYTYKNSMYTWVCTYICFALAQRGSVESPLIAVTKGSWDRILPGIQC